jgi:hypothetical protein
MKNALLKNYSPIAILFFSISNRQSPPKIFPASQWIFSGTIANLQSPSYFFQPADDFFGLKTFLLRQKNTSNNPVKSGTIAKNLFPTAAFVKVGSLEASTGLDMTSSSLDYDNPGLNLVSL